MEEDRRRKTFSVAPQIAETLFRAFLKPSHVRNAPRFLDSELEAYRYPRDRSNCLYDVYIKRMLSLDTSLRHNRRSELVNSMGSTFYDEPKCKRPLAQST